MNRYEPIPNPTEPFGFTMEESETGDWIKYEDINKLRAQAVRECAAALEIDTLRNGSDAMYMRDYADKIERGEA